MAGPSPYAHMAPMGAPTAAAPPADQPVYVKERPFVAGLLLTIVTLGIYPFYWHYVTHDELCRQLGRENRERSLLLALVAIAVLGILLWVTLVVRIVRAAFRAGDRGRIRSIDVVEIVGDSVLLGVSFGLAAIVALVLLTIYVSRQYEVIQAAKHVYGLRMQNGAGWFFGFYFGSLAATVFLPIFPFHLVGMPIAYYNLQEHYNELHRLYSGRSTTAPHAPDARGMSPYPPTVSHPQAHGTAPGTWAWTGASGPGSAAAGGTMADRGTSSAAPAHGGHTWGGPGSYRVGQRTAPPPAHQGHLVEQAFECPRCRSHVTARGPAGSDVQIQCAACGEAGLVTLSS